MIAPRRETNKQIARVEGAHFFSATREGLNRGRRKHGLRGFFSDESSGAFESGGAAAALQIALERGDSVAEAKCARVEERGFSGLAERAGGLIASWIQGGQG
jgi:hypothetical protein